MKKINTVILKIFALLSILLFLMYLSSCSKDESTNPVISSQGVLVLYEGTGTPGTGDYAFINLDNNTVTTDVYQQSNNNANLGLYPDGMLLYGKFLYVTSQGNYNNAGRMFKIGTSDNKLLDTLTFGKNPYDFALAELNLYVTNIAGSFVTKVSLDLFIDNSDIEVGLNPAEIISAVPNLYVTKASYTTENSLAVINPLNDHVTKIFFTAPPVSAAFQFNGVYVSTFTNKKLYLVDTVVSPTGVKDSIVIPTTLPAIGDVVAGDFPNLYIVAIDIVSFNNVGRLVYKVNLFTKAVSLLINDPENINIYGISYDIVKSRIYIADSRNGSANGIVRSYKTDGTWLNSYDIGARTPRKFAFMH